MRKNADLGGRVGGIQAGGGRAEIFEHTLLAAANFIFLYFCSVIFNKKYSSTKIFHVQS